MHIIKLNATNSTNDYLKDILRNQFLENFTIVVSNKQEKGRGQHGASWQSEDGKNLTFSILIKDLIQNASELFTLNIAIALGVFEAINQLTRTKTAVKWPNDIMADSKKVAGILIENSIQQNGEIYSIVGIGLNVNQLIFDDLPKVTSLQLLENKTFNLDEVLFLLLEHIKHNISLIVSKPHLLWEKYSTNLFKKEIPSTFEDIHQQKFMGIIKGVSKNGLLQVQLEDELTKEFTIKEIKMLY